MSAWASATWSAPASTPASTAILAQKRSSIDLSVTDPYFLDRNLVAGADVFLIQTDYLGTEPYDERRIGFALRLGYDFNDHLRQVWTYSLVERDGVRRCHHGERLHRQTRLASTCCRRSARC